MTGRGYKPDTPSPGLLASASDMLLKAPRWEWAGDSSENLASFCSQLLPRGFRDAGSGWVPVGQPLQVGTR